MINDGFGAPASKRCVRSVHRSARWRLLMSKKKTDDDYVRHGCPPKHTRFKPNQSGNPSGHPKGAIGVRQLTRRWLRKKVKVQLPGGQVVTMSNAEIIVAKLGQEAKQGDLKSAQWLIQFGDVAEKQTVRDHPAYRC